MEGSQRDPSSTTNTGNDRSAKLCWLSRWFSPCVHRFHLVPFDLCLPGEDRNEKWVQENKSDLQIRFRKNSAPCGGLPCSLCALFHPAEKRSNVKPRRCIHAETNPNIVSAACDCTFSPLGPRSPWKQKDTCQKVVNTVDSHWRGTLAKFRGYSQL